MPYAALPRVLAIRAVTGGVGPPGFRTRRRVVVSAPRDADAYPAAGPPARYRARWHAERELRPLKGTPGRAVLRGRAPAMAREEFRRHLRAYHLIRAVMARAARDQGARRGS